LSVFDTSEKLNDHVILAHIRNSRGEFVKPSRTSMNTAVSKSNSATNQTLYDDKRTTIPSANELNLFNIPEKGAYPIVAYSYWCFQTHYPLATRGRSVLLFFTDSYTLLETPGYSPNVTIGILPPRLLKFCRKLIQNTLSCGANTDLFCKDEVPDIGSAIYLPLTITLSIVAIIALLLVIAGCMYFCYLKLRGHIPSTGSQHLNISGNSSMRKLKKQKKNDQLTESLIDKDILKEINGDLRTTINVEEFTLEQQIGSGSFSEVYRGKWMGAPVAIKRFLLIDVEAQREVLDDFLKETTLMSSLHHPNIVIFFGASKKHPHLYILTEFCERGSLYSILKNKNIALSMRKTLNMAIDTARGMSYLHSSNPPIIHRDLKTANLLVDKNWAVKVADFGLSRVVDQSRQMTLCGTAETAAPEVLCKSGSYTEKADVYSFGIVLWEMISRKPLYPDLNFFELSQKVVHEDFRPDVKELPDKTPPELVKLMQDCWQKRAEKRPTFDEVREILEKILDKYVTARESAKKTNKQNNNNKKKETGDDAV
jgi:hypothetical protein